MRPINQLVPADIRRLPCIYTGEVVVPNGLRDTQNMDEDCLPHTELDLMQKVGHKYLVELQALLLKLLV